jgi:hypothetical protein
VFDLDPGVKVFRKPVRYLVSDPSLTKGGFDKYPYRYE